MKFWNLLLLIFGLSSAFAAVVMSVIVIRLQRRQFRAYKGDESAARHLVLPFYAPIFKFCVVYLALMALLLLSIAVSSPQRISLLGLECGFIFSSFAFSFAPVLLTQKSVTLESVKKVFAKAGPWLALSVALWIFITVSDNHMIKFGLKIIFLLSLVLLPLVTCALMVFRIIRSRVTFASASSRCIVTHFMIFTTGLAVFFVVDFFTHHGEIEKIVMTIAISWNLLLLAIFPITLYRSLLADTKFWRGLGVHNSGGIRNSRLSVHKRGSSPNKLIKRISSSNVDSDSAADDADNVTKRPSEIDLSTASSHFQSVMNDISEVMIDFAFIEIKSVIGHGASSEVLGGVYKSNQVAIKVSSPPEITEEILSSFLEEASITSSLDHPNIVKFYGICVRPPEIGMVIEYCSRGNLKSSLLKFPAEWTTYRRIRAALQAARALDYLHSAQVIHRDVKADNFFVDEDWNIKLGDFGESLFVPKKAKGRRMTVLGTVAFMAPELVGAEKEYTESIDIYALGITMWEIWTGSDPYSKFDTFEVYKKVAIGERPEVPAGAPRGFVDVMCRAWSHDPKNRPSAVECVDALETVLSFYSADAESSSTPHSGQSQNPRDSVESVQKYLRSFSNTKLENPVGSTADRQIEVEIPSINLVQQDNTTTNAMHSSTLISSAI
jgi:serine/threonine protein kinase